jgi:uncharacterized membrane protein YeaQ/YmgE (transglycosylase-associated protein family)
MGLLILIFSGCMMGWVFSILLDQNDREEQATNVMAGVTGSVGAGLLASSGSVLLLPAMGLVAALGGAAGALAVLNLVRGPA